MIDFEKTVSDVMLFLQSEFRAAVEQQGHVLTGGLMDSIEYEVHPDGNGAAGRMFVADYGLAVEFGVSAQKIPYQPGSGKKTSKYIEGLIRFWQLRGLAGREAVSAAFATAKIHKREGMPTRGSYRFSKTGERTGFVRSTVERNLEKIVAMIEQRVGSKIEIFLPASAGEFEYLTFKN